MDATPSLVKILIGPAALALAVGIAACGGAAGAGGAFPTVFTPAAHPSGNAAARPSDSAIAWPTDEQLRAYLKAHPAPALPGMTAGIRSFYALSPTRDIRCGGGRGSAVTVGNADDCLAWQVTLITATGTIVVTCGNLTAGIACPSAVYSDRGQYPLPAPGDYLYAPSDGQVTVSRDVLLIKRGAIS